MGTVRTTRSLRVEIVAGFAMLVVALGAVGGFAVWRQAAAVEALGLQNHVYLPIALRLGEANANQNSMNTLLERLVEVDDRAAWVAWISGARRTRRSVIQRLGGLATEASAGTRGADAELLGDVVRTLADVDRSYRENERAFGALGDALEVGDLRRVESVQGPLLAQEQHTQDALRRLNRRVEERIQDLARAAEQEQPRTLRVLAIVTGVAVLAGLFTLLTGYRALRPLALLIGRVRAVASGDLSPRVVPARPDEIGELAREFENMVDAVKVRDTTLRAQAEDIRRAEQHLEQVVATLRAAVIVVARDGTVRSANPAAARIANGEVPVGAAFEHTSLGRVADIGSLVRDVRRGARAGGSLLAVAMGEQALDVAVATFVTPDGSGNGALVVIDDVTEREQARARMLQNERLAAIGRMAAHVTHEVRNPLSSMALNAEMLADEARGLGEGAHEVERLVAAIQKEIDRLTAITEEYLRVARLPRPRLEREDVATLVEESVAFVRTEFERAGITLTLQVESGVPASMLDEAQIRQALLNLMRNAREAMEASPSGARSVMVRVARAREGAQIAISDSGPGIRPEVRAHLFELFFTTKEKGSGLGLPLTREIVVAHRGTLEVQSASAEHGGGAEFVIWLPPAPDAAGHGGTRDAA